MTSSQVNVAAGNSIGLPEVSSKFDPDFTRKVINATGPKAQPRIRDLVGNLVQHLHDFCRENEVTVEEWMAAVNFVSSLLTFHVA